MIDGKVLRVHVRCMHYEKKILKDVMESLNSRRLRKPSAFRKLAQHFDLFSEKPTNPYQHFDPSSMKPRYYQHFDPFSIKLSNYYEHLPSFVNEAQHNSYPHFNPFFK